MQAKWPLFYTPFELESGPVFPFLIDAPLPPEDTLHGWGVHAKGRGIWGVVYKVPAAKGLTTYSTPPKHTLWPKERESVTETGLTSHVLATQGGTHRPCDIPLKIPGYPANKLGFPGLRRTYLNFLVRTPSHGRPSPHPKISGPKIWVWVLFSCLILAKDKERKRRKASAESGGIFPTEFLGEFRGDVFVDFWELWSLEETGGKAPPKNPHQNSNQSLGILRPKSTLQGSGHDKEGTRAINLNNFGEILPKLDPGPFLYVWPVSGLQNYLC